MEFFVKNKTLAMTSKIQSIFLVYRILLVEESFYLRNCMSGMGINSLNKIVFITYLRIKIA